MSVHNEIRGFDREHVPEGWGITQFMQLHVYARQEETCSVWLYDCDTKYSRSPRSTFGSDCHHSESIELFEEPCAALELASTFKQPPLKHPPLPSAQCARRTHV